MFSVNRRSLTVGLWIVTAVCLVGLTSGCGGPAYEGEPRAAVGGSVTLDGAPMVYGVISFIPTGEGRNASGPIQNGSYAIPELNGPNLGNYRVQIMPQDPPEEGGEGSEDDEEEVAAGEEAEDTDDEDSEEGGGGERSSQQVFTEEVEIVADAAKKYDFALKSEDAGGLEIPND